MDTPVEKEKTISIPNTVIKLTIVIKQYTRTRNSLQIFFPKFPAFNDSYDNYLRFRDAYVRE